MTGIRTETLELTDGRRLRMTVAQPESKVVRGGLVVLHEARGVTQAVRGLLTSLAAEGWLAVAPHIYGSDGAEALDAANAADQVSKLSGDAVLADTDAAFVWLGDQGISPDRMGVAGFDLGGSVALLVAAHRTLGAAVSVAGGGIKQPLSEGMPRLVDLAGELATPWLGIYGDLDELIPVQEVDELRDAVRTAPVVTEIIRFPQANHRFDTDPAAAFDGWQRTLNWFDAHLR